MDAFINSKKREWKYYKCNICGHGNIYINRDGSLQPVSCKTCGEMIQFDQNVEDEWLDEVDENGKKKHMDFFGKTEKRCLARAAKYFKCEEKELCYFLVQRKNSYQDFVINASKWVEYKEQEGDIKIVSSKNILTGNETCWYIVNMNEKTVSQVDQYGETKIHFDTIDKIEYTEDRKKYIIHFSPKGKMLFNRSSDGKKLLEVLNEYLPVTKEKIGVFSTEWAHKADNKIPDSCKSYYYEISYRDLKVRGYGPVWKTDTELCFLLQNESKIYQVPLDKIKCYRLVGEKYYTSEVSGGGGGGSSVKGAVVGGLIAGGAGAVIGSRNEINEIHSSNKLHDDREIWMYFNNDDQMAHINSSMYEVLNDLIPNKEYDMVSAEKTTEASNGNNDLEILEQLADLCKKGIITEEEFNEKKKEILSRI